MLSVNLLLPLPPPLTLPYGRDREVPPLPRAVAVEGAPSLDLRSYLAVPLKLLAKEGECQFST